MENKNFFVRVYRFYLEGFRSMTIGKTLWAIILIKYFILFFVIKLLFFPSVLGKYSTDAQKQEHVGNELINRAIPK